MNLTSKSRYAFKIMVDLARKPRDSRLDRSRIAEELGIPTHYLDQILMRLRKAELIQSYRGRLGGFVLAQSPDEVNALDIVEAVEAEIAPVVCLEHGGTCPLADDCNSRDAWHLVHGTLRSSLQGISLAALASFKVPDNQIAKTLGAASTERSPQTLSRSTELLAARPSTHASVESTS